MEAAYCSNGRCLYVFGGTRTCVSDAAFARMISHTINQFCGTEMPDTEPLGDLWMLDLATCQWTQLSDDALPGYTGPSPRSFGALAFDSPSNSLLLFGGLPARFSLNPKFSSSCNNDLWRYDLTSRVWTRIIGQHCGPVSSASILAAPKPDLAPFMAVACSSSTPMGRRRPMGIAFQQHGNHAL